MDNYLENINEYQSGKKLKKAAYIVAALITVLGAMAVFAPAITGLGIAYFITAGFFIYGIMKVVTWFKLPDELRNGFFLADGIISAFLGGMILFDALRGPEGQVSMLFVLSFTAGFMSTVNGITMLASYGSLKRAGFPSSGSILWGGILRLLIGILIILNPIGGWFTLQWSWGILFVITGVAMFFEIKDLPL